MKLAAALLLLGLQPGPSPVLTLERIFSDPPLEGPAPMAVRLSPSGRYATYLQPSADDSEVLDLWGVALPDGKPQLLVATADLLAGEAQKLTEQEKMALERKRISKRGITSYRWCGKDDSALVFPLSGNLHHAALVPGQKPKVTALTHDDEPELDPACSPDGGRLAYVKKGDVFVMDLATRKARQLTKGANATRSFGLAEFIAQEEMGRHKGMWWSPDGKSLLVFEVDESAVGTKVRPQIFADRTELISQRYPAAGEKNAVVTPWLIQVDSGRKVKLEIPREDGYLPRAGFFPDGKPWLLWQSRDQTRVVLQENDAKGKARQILEEKDPAWVELHDDLHPLSDSRRFLWSSEQSGRRQLVVVDRQTGAVTPLTAEPEPVISLLAVDEKAGVVFFSVARDRGRQSAVARIPLEGGPSTVLTPEPGMHTATFDDEGHFFVDTHATIDRPATTTVRDASGKRVFTLPADPLAELAQHTLPTPVWLDLRAEDGSTLNGLLYAPAQLGPGKKAPVITHIYGGPTGQMVQKAWTKTRLMAAFWTQRGFGVFLVDGRGMGTRDRAFARAHHGRFGDVEVEDLYAAVKQLKATVPWVDGDNIGVFGWSYGGFLAARAVLDDKTPFAAAVSVAPVTDWTLYDTHYTERYLGMPQQDGSLSASYAKANLVDRAALLERPLLLMHGTADDNVLFEHTLRLTEALQKEAKPFDLMIYPGKAHGIAGKTTQRHVFQTVTSFFERHLR